MHEEEGAKIWLSEHPEVNEFFPTFAEEQKRLNYEGYPESYRFVVVYDNQLLYDGRGKEKSEYSIYRKQHNARGFVGKSET